MAIDIIGEVIGGIVEGVIEVLFSRARGWSLFWRLVIFFVVLPLAIFGLFCIFS